MLPLNTTVALNWRSGSESNERPSRLQRDALPTELPKHLKLGTRERFRTSNRSGLNRPRLPIAPRGHLVSAGGLEPPSTRV